MSVSRRTFNAGLAAAALSTFGMVRAQPTRLRIGVLLPRSGVQALIGQSCQKGADIVTQGLWLMGDLFRATKVAPRTAVFMHVNDTFGQAIAKAVGAILPKLTHLPFRIVDTISYDPTAKDLSLEVSKAKASNADFLMPVCRLNDAIILRREMVKQRWPPMGVVNPSSPCIYEEQFAKSLGKLADYCITNNPWYNPRAELTKTFGRAFAKSYPNDNIVYPGVNSGFTFEPILIAADAFRRAKSTDPKTLAEAIRATDITNRMCLGGPIRFNAKGQVEGTLMAGLQIQGGLPKVIFPQAVDEAKPVFPMSE